MLCSKGALKEKSFSGYGRAIKPALPEKLRYWFLGFTSTGQWGSMGSICIIPAGFGKMVYAINAVKVTGSIQIAI